MKKHYIYIKRYVKPKAMGWNYERKLQSKLWDRTRALELEVQLQL